MRFDAPVAWVLAHVSATGAPGRPKACVPLCERAGSAKVAGGCRDISGVVPYYRAAGEKRALLDSFYLSLVHVKLNSTQFSAPLHSCSTLTMASSGIFNF